MGAVIEVKYFNTFVLKKTNSINEPIWNGSFGIPVDIGGYPVVAAPAGNQSFNFAIEESRIRGGYNNTTVSFGAKAYLVEDEPNSVIRFNSLIYSGIFNSRTGINQSNVFSIGESIVKSADPSNGGIQKLYAEDTNLIIFQEAKISRALIDKDAIYSAEGGGSITNALLTIGTIQPYAGEFGISRDPGSFAVYGYRKYFTDKDRNAVLRLSKDGLTEISNYGMYDYFRDQFERIDIGVKSGVIIAGWDIHNKQYVLSTQANAGSTNSSGFSDEKFNTLSYDETVRGWTSFYSYRPQQVFSIRNNMYTISPPIPNLGGCNLWVHYAPGNSRGRFYGKRNESSVSVVFNSSPSMSKVFQTVNYEGSNGWKLNSFVSDLTGKNFGGNPTPSWSNDNDRTNSIYSYTEGEYAINPANGQVVERADYLAVFGTINPPYIRYYAGFDRKENKYFANVVNSSVSSQGEVIWGDSISGIKGYFVTATFSTDLTTDLGGSKNLFSVASKFVQSY